MTQEQLETITGYLWAAWDALAALSGAIDDVYTDTHDDDVSVR